MTSNYKDIKETLLGGSLVFPNPTFKKKSSDFILVLFKYLFVWTIFKYFKIIIFKGLIVHVIGTKKNKPLTHLGEWTFMRKIKRGVKSDFTPLISKTDAILPLKGIG